MSKIFKNYPKLSDTFDPPESAVEIYHQGIDDETNEILELELEKILKTESKDIEDMYHKANTKGMNGDITQDVRPIDPCLRKIEEQESKVAEELYDNDDHIDKEDEHENGHVIDTRQKSINPSNTTHCDENDEIHDNPHVLDTKRAEDIVEWDEKKEEDGGKMDVLKQQSRAEGMHIKTTDGMDNYLNWDHNDILRWILGLDDGLFVVYEDQLRYALNGNKIKGVQLGKIEYDDIDAWGVTDFKHNEILQKYFQNLRKDGDI